MFTDSLALLSMGFVLGMGHAFEADHLAAVSALVSKHRDLKKATVLGVFWGLGHTTTLFITGLLVLALNLTIPERIALSFEFIVGMVIVLLGVSVIRDVIVDKKHIHTHTHDGISSIHLHSHKETDTHNHSHRSFAVGLIHGMAGSATLLLLVLSTVNSTALGALYILVFGVGSIAGMTLASMLIGLPFTFTAKKLSSWNTGIRCVTGVFSILFGTFLMVKIGYMEGLF